MKVALVSEHANPLATLGGVDAGGQNVHVAALAGELARLGVSVTVYTRRDDPETPPRVVTAEGYVVEHVVAGPATALPKDDIWNHIDEFFQHLRSRWQHSRPDIVHAHFWMSGYAARRATAGMDIPVVQTFHALGHVKRRCQGAADSSPRERESVEGQIARSVDAILATCSDEAKELGFLGAERNRIEIVPCGVDLDLFHPDGAVSKRRSGRFRIVSVGRLVERKGVEDLIRALKSVPNAELMVAGGPPLSLLQSDEYVVQLQNLVAHLGLDDRVQFLGGIEHEELPSLLRSADVGVCVPWYEPFGIVPLELMACGVPVIASAVGGLLDTVLPEVTGLVVPPQDPGAISDALNRLAHDDLLRKQMSVAAVTRSRLYGWPEIARRTAAVYDDVLKSASARIAPRTMEGTL